MLLKKTNVQAFILIFTLALSLSNAQAVTTPVQIATGMTGVGTDSPNLLLVAQPIQNIGTATAMNVMITSINLASSLVVEGDFPMSLGDLSKDESAVVNVQFDRSPLTPGTKYRMTLNGTYQLADTGDKMYGFSVNRNVTVPPSSPGSSSVKTSSITSFTVTDPPKFPIPEALSDRAEGSRNPKRPPVPVGRFQIVYPKAFSTPPMGEQPPGGDGPASAVPKVSFDNNTPFGPNSTLTPVDPSGASGRTENGQGVVLTTGNTYASVSIDGGQTFTNINPFCMFGYSNCDAAGNPTGTPLVDGNLCCDQVVHYAPAINRFVWLMQTWPSGWINGVQSVPSPIPGAPPILLASGTNRLRLVIVSPDDIRNWVTGAGSSWTVYDIPTATFNLTGGNDWMDYPDMSVSNNFLYVSVDKIHNNGGLIVARIPLNQLLAGGTIDIAFTDPSDIDNRAHGSHLIQNPTDTMYWAGHNKNTELTVFDWPENSNIFSWREIKHNSYANSDYSSITPTNTDWLMGSTPGRFGTENIQGAVRVPIIGICPPEGCRADEIRFAWGAGRTTNRPQPYVEVVHIDSGNFTLIEQMHIWNPNFAFAYPAFATNANKNFADVGVAIGVGGGVIGKPIHRLALWAILKSGRYLIVILLLPAMAII